jgi:cyclic pyranopterin phosphate synthase|tara:strand:- start:2111 stop:2581 length:471 start_codon:yes stop_codon:yes gene_type:complete
MKLTHADKGGVKMVEISEKEDIRRIAIAQGKIKLKEETIEILKSGKIEKGNVLTTAQIAATQAVKKTSDIIPLCHPLQITGIRVNFEINNDNLKVKVKVTTIGKTGVEMEALTGVTIALLTIWDMVKANEKDQYGQYPQAKISDVYVVEKIKGDRN